MKIQTIIDRLTADGYKLTRSIGTGNIIAVKGSRSYIASSYAELWRKIKG